jgi:hypothetical protein
MFLLNSFVMSLNIGDFTEAKLPEFALIFLLTINENQSTLTLN